MADVGFPPPPSTDVASQMKPSTPVNDLSSLIGQFATQQTGTPVADISGKVMQVEPILNQIAAQVPSLAPDVGSLLGQLKSRMGGTVAGLLGLANPNPAGQPAPPIPPLPTAGAAAPGLPPNPVAQGAMDLAMQLEMLLPPIGSDDPVLMPQIQFFIARMREEVPKVVNGTTEDQSAALLKNPAPTDDMFKKLPVTA